ncbi:hypothetical protein AB0E63_03625 [Kribbella sp. NPDC026596]|uniref:hypothetical protein n=1 Tax=Kribbella sp. NPDC026596 TaxID=3155122 RepID=UPI0033E2248C
MLEQVFGSCLEVLGAEHLEAEGVGESAGCVEGGADCQRVFDLLGCGAGGQDFAHVFGTDLLLRGQFAEHSQRCADAEPV